ncbi:hypothetical protein IP76_17900 [Rhizobium sp. AAP43]|nr:hypothetical protein IP76_17900 [Rhizobium sp. AAP43]
MPQIQNSRIARIWGDGFIVHGWSWSLFLAFALFPYTVGFLLLCFWWRLESMLPAWGVAFAFAALASLSVGQSDGLEAGLASILLLFFIIGAVSGAVASVLINRGRASQWRLGNTERKEK